MWRDALRKLLRQDAEPEEAPAPHDPAREPQPNSGHATGVEADASQQVEADASQQAAAGATADSALSPTRTAEAQRATDTEPAMSRAAGAPATPADVEVSPPGHAPQGLAAEAATAQDVAPVEPPPFEQDDDTTLSDADTNVAPARADATEASTTETAGGDGASHAALESDDTTTSVPGLPKPSVSAAGTEIAPAVEQSVGEQPGPRDGQSTGAAMAAESTPAQAPTEEAAPSEAATAGPQAAATESAAQEQETAAEAAGPEQQPVAAAAAPEREPAAAVAAPEQQPVAEGPPATAEADEAAVVQATAAPAPTFGPLAPGTVVGDRYAITAVIEDGEPPADEVRYTASDTRSYERCWSCGSTDNGPSTRFCQNCGAPIQDHPVMLVQTRTATGEPGEIEQDGAFFHVQPERRMFGAEGVGIEIGACSAEGPHHPNEDSYWYTTRTLCANSLRQSTAVAVFADGMGGYAPGSGLISSRIASTVGTQILAALEGRADAQGALDEPEAEAIMRHAIAAANALVLDEIARSGEMGSTLVAVMVLGDTAYVANVGDSRAYYVDPRGHVTAITRDQSLVGEQVQQGLMAEDDMYTALGSNIILHAVGEEGVEDVADWYVQPLEPGSYLLMCSDGYWKTLRGAVLPEGALRESDTMSEAARRLVDDALARGSDDNTTLLLIAVS